MHFAFFYCGCMLVFAGFGFGSSKYRRPPTYDLTPRRIGVRTAGSWPSPTKIGGRTGLGGG